MSINMLGLQVRVHPTWLLVGGLIVLALGTIGAPGVVRLDGIERWLMAGAVAGLFFVSVLAHELAHALTSRRLGLEVRQVTVNILGGIASLERSAPTPRSEALITASGPALSLVVGSGLLLVALTSENVTGVLGGFVHAVSWWVGMANLLLAGFNAIPSFPMDGGRLLRAGLWAATGDFARATRLATLVGRAFAVGLVVVGVALAVAGQFVLGVWLAFIGWFLYQAARAAARRAEVSRLIDGLLVRDVMERDVAVVGPNLTLDTLAQQRGTGLRGDLYPVMHDGRLVGTVDMRRVSRVRESDWATTRVTDVMARGAQLVTLTEPTPVLDAMARLDETGASALPVVDVEDDNQLLGLVTREGLMRTLRRRAELKALRVGQ